MAATTSRGIRARYKRLLLKLSGEALMGKGDYGIDMAVVQRLAGEISRSHGGRVRDRRRGRRRQHLPRPRRRRQGHGPRHRRLHGHAGHRDERAGPAECAGAAGRAGARPLGHPDADRLRELRALQGAASPGERARRDLRRRHRQPFLHHRHDGGAAGHRDELRGAGQGDPGRRRLFCRSARRTPTPCATTG